MNKNIKVSVIVPVYKVPLEYLRTCLDSLVAQTLQECEFIVVSDGAPEAECSVCEEYVAKDSRFKFFKCEHAGVSVARNFGISQAQGEYTSFVDSDDWISSDIFQKAYDFSKKENSDVTFWNYVITSPQRMIPVRYSTMNVCVLSDENLASIRDNLVFVGKGNLQVFVNLWSKIYKTSLIKAVSFEENLHIGSDRVFCIQVYSNNIRIAYLNQDSYFYRQNSESIVHRYRPDAFDAFMKYIRKSNEMTNGVYHGEICNEILYKFCESLSLDYFHKDNSIPFKENINRLKQVFYSEEFRKSVDGCIYRKMNRSHKIDYFFIKYKFFPWLYIRTVLLGLKKKFG